MVGGILLALLLDQPIFGQGIVRMHGDRAVLRHADGAALVWKNMLMHPVSGLFAWIARVARPAADRLVRRLRRCSSVIIIVAWQWLPFATLILLTALQSLDDEQKEAAEMDGAGFALRLHLHHAAAPGARRSPSSS